MICGMSGPCTGPMATARQYVSECEDPATRRKPQVRGQLQQYRMQLCSALGACRSRCRCRRGSFSEAFNCKRCQRAPQQQVDDPGQRPASADSSCVCRTGCSLREGPVPYTEETSLGQAAASDQDQLRAQKSRLKRATQTQASSACPQKRHSNTRAVDPSRWEGTAHVRHTSRHRWGEGRKCSGPTDLASRCTAATYG